MKKIILFVLLLSMPFGLIAQKITINKIDDFTGAKIFETSWVDVFELISFQINKTDDKTFLNSIFYSSSTPYTAHEEDELLLKLEGDEIITLKNLKTTTSGLYGSGMTSHFSLPTSYILSKEQIDKLKTTKIIKVRLYYGDKYYEETTKEKNQSKLLKMFNLLQL